MAWIDLILRYNLILSEAFKILKHTKLSRFLWATAIKKSSERCLDINYTKNRINPSWNVSIHIIR